LRSHGPLLHKELVKQPTVTACYLFTISNSGLLLATVGRSHRTASIAEKETFSPDDRELWQ